MFKIEATADTHFVISPEFFSGADVLVVAGDFLMIGSAAEVFERLEAIRALPHPTKIVVCGNHDKCFDPLIGHEFYVFVQKVYPDITFLGYPFNTSVTINGKLFLALPYVSTLPRWGFNKDEAWLEMLVTTLPKADVVISHAPPKGIRDGREVGESWGVGAWVNYLHGASPKVWICGHVHESYGVEKVADTVVYNVSMCDEHYRQVNKPMIIEVA